LNCPDCEGSLKLRAKIVCESSDRIKTYTYQWWICKKCGAGFFAQLTEFVFDESLDHVGYDAGKNFSDDLKEALKCPKPENPLCTCEAHKRDGDYQLGKQRWVA